MNIVRILNKAQKDSNMREELRNILNRNRKRLVNELDIKTTFLVSLLSDGVVCAEDKATIEVSIAHSNTKDV